jgi:uncharacterized cupredoxin-like copper-binding protein
MRQLAYRWILAFTLLVGAAVGLVQVAQARQASTTIQVKGGEFFFKLSTKALSKPGKVTFAFTNVGHVAHDFKIAGKVTPLISPGKTARLAVTFKRKGKFPYMCTVPGHAAAGMRGILVVR